MNFRLIIQNPRIWLFVALVVVGLCAAGCATDEPDNLSSKPWNSPEGWQNGNLPSNLYQGH
jgi:hypothetical protein